MADIVGKSSQDDALRTVLRFSDSDLECNAKGLLSESQKSRLEARGLRRACLMTMPVLPWITVVTWLVRTPQSHQAIVAAGMLGGAVLPLYIVLIYKYWNQVTSFQMASVACIEGKVWHTETHFYVNSYLLTVGNQMFKVNRPLFCAFNEGDFYRVYFVPHGPIFSAEWLQGSEYGKAKTR